jgi:hypothetical protein
MLRNRSLSAVAVFGAVALLLIGQAAIASADPNKGMQWKTMVGVPAGLTGAQSQIPLRGLSGGGIPWMLESGRGMLQANGHVEVEVEGLVLASGALAGTNPISAFKVLVSCVNADGTFSNVLSTASFPATTGAASAGGGDSTLETTLALPSPCLAPIIFVTSGGGSWFASTGF